MVRCERTNVWSKQEKYWSTVAIGIDSKGRALFLFARTPYAVHDFIDMMLALPIDLQRCMYLEGRSRGKFHSSPSQKGPYPHGQLRNGFP